MDQRHLETCKQDKRVEISVKFVDKEEEVLRFTHWVEFSGSKMGKCGKNTEIATSTLVKLDNCQ